MTEVKAAALSGAALRYAVAIACGFKVQRIEEGDYNTGEAHWWMAYDERRVTPTRNGLVGYIKPGAKGVTGIYDYCPDAAWSQGGPLIRHFKVGLVPLNVGLSNESAEAWVATAFFDGKSAERCGRGDGKTELVAVCRAIVRLILGDTIAVPSELLRDGEV
ncbi:phage protein NinX family protein [Pseudomonas sp.]|uniref:phage protein NinX family protein n=1 Tax=Pseudomonas sp. TaxID=306 RepID=UPI00258643CE|nr:phage protein NinX family protein [Pseudomonas sp.]